MNKNVRTKYYSDSLSYHYFSYAIKKCLNRVLDNINNYHAYITNSKEYVKQNSSFEYISNDVVNDIQDALFS